MAEYNPALEAVNLFSRHETHVHGLIAKRNDEVERLTEQMGQLEQFLALLSSQSEEFKKDENHQVHLTDEDLTLLNTLTNHPELQHIFPAGQFSWVNEEIPALLREIAENVDRTLGDVKDFVHPTLTEKFKELTDNENVKRLVTQRIEGPLQRKVQMTTEQIMFDQNDLLKSAEMFNKTLQRMLNFIEQILRNINKAH